MLRNVILVRVRVIVRNVSSLYFGLLITLLQLYSKWTFIDILKCYFFARETNIE